MKKRAEKTKSKSASAKGNAAHKEPPRRPATASPHDPLHNLLRGTYAHRTCGARGY